MVEKTISYGTIDVDMADAEKSRFAKSAGRLDKGDTTMRILILSCNTGEGHIAIFRGFLDWDTNLKNSTL